MPPHGRGLSLPGVITWARTRFKDDFVKIPTATQFNKQTVHPSDWETSFEAIVVGTAFEEVRPYFRATTNVLAWLNHGRVQIGYISQVGSQRNTVLYQSLTDGRIDFHEPYSFILRAGDETAVRRFEALIQYAVLTRRGPLKAVSASAVSDFREHFPGACRDIAQVANQRLAEWSRITAPLEPNEDAPLENDADLTEVPSATIASAPPPVQDNVPDISTPATETEAQNEAAEAVYHSQMLAKYTDSWTTLTRKMNTITRLHTREKKQLQAKIKNLEKAVASASEDATKAKKEVEKAQEKTRLAQDIIKKAQQQEKRAREKATKAEAETQRVREEAGRASKAGGEALRLCAEFQRLEQMLVAVSSETAKAKEEAQKTNEQHSATNKICASQQNDVAAWKNKHEAMATSFEGMCQVAVAWEAEHKKLRASVDTVFGASVQVGGQVGGQMKSVMGHQDIVQAGAQGHGQARIRFR